MEALRITPQQQDVSGINKEGMIESQDDEMMSSFEMLSNLPVIDDEAVLYDLLGNISLPQEGAIKHDPLLMTMEVDSDNLPKTMQQTVAELSAANTRQLSASLISMPAEQQSSASVTVLPIATAPAIKNDIIGQATTSSSTPNIASLSTAPTFTVVPTDTPAMSAVPLSSATATLNPPSLATASTPLAHKSELMSAPLADFQLNNSANLIMPGAGTKAIEWAKVDLTATINNHSDKSTLASTIGEKLHAILQDKISVQASNGIKTAQIRLDPPDMGHIRLTVSVEGDKISVNVSAQNLQVREGLMQTSERLRHELVNQNFVDVSIDINAGSENHNESSQEQQQQQQVARNIFTEKDVLDKSQDEFIVKV